MDKGRGIGLCTALLFFATAIAAPAQTLTTLARFTGPNGAYPQSALVQSSDGSFYGTTQEGGASNNGTVFKITPGGTLTTLYSFCSQAGCADGQFPIAALTRGADGNFYGTSPNGGANSNGTVYKITPGGTLTTLHSFCSQAGCADGVGPVAGVIQASDGDFYGTTQQGGVNNQGTVYKITSGGTLTTLYSFCPTVGCADGTLPLGRLMQASDGNFYGTTEGGGNNNKGTIFKITPAGALTSLHSFCSQAGCADGVVPADGLVQASDGYLYGTSPSGGGANNGGTFFKITPEGTLTTLYVFCSEALCLDGASPRGGPLLASDGNFYGSTFYGGTISSGTLYRITPAGSLTTLYDFCSEALCADGSTVLAGLIQAKDGNLYGTTEEGGGADAVGSVFRLTPASSTTSPAINQGGVVSGGSFEPGIVAGSWITIFGTNLASKTDTWADAIANGSLPTSLDGVKVSVGGEPAYIAYISPTQINAVAPDVGAGTVSVTVTNSIGTSSAVTANIQTVQLAFFQWGNYAVATTQDYKLAVANGTLLGVITMPAKPGQVIILWGTGFGVTNPSVPMGVEVPSSGTYHTANAVTVTVGGLAASVYGAALAPGFAGLYQVAIQIPDSLANGDYPVIATISNVQSSALTLIAVQD